MKKALLIVVALVFVALPIVAWAQWLQGGLPWSAYLYSLGRIMALLGFVMLFFQYVLSSRMRWLERDIGLDKLIVLHRTTGLAGFLLISTHPVLLIAADLVHGFPISFPRAKLVGVAAMVLVWVAAGAALLYRRLKWSYETWKTLHLAAYAVLPIGLLHSLVLGSDVSRPPLRAFWILLGVLYVAILAYKLWVRVQVHRHPYRVSAVTQETHDTWTVCFDGPPLEHHPGQFMIVRLERAGFRSESHPFTIASSPTSPGPCITVKSVGDFTATIGQTRVGDRAYIDAPYGALSFVLRDAEELVFVAGGIGITPFVSMLRHMRDKGIARKVLLVWGNKSEQDLAFREELEQLAAELPSLRVVHVMSRQDDWPGEKGYVTQERLAALMKGLQSPRVFVCGPPVMTSMVLGALPTLGVPRSRVHFERFALR